MWYGIKKEDGSWQSSLETQFEGSFPIITTRQIPIFSILVFDNLQSAWVEDQELEKEYLLEEAISKRIKKQEFGSKFLASVVELNVAKFVSGSISQSDLTAMDTDASLQAMERAAWRGNITTLKGLVQSYSGSYYTTQEKTDLIALIDESGLI